MKESRLRKLVRQEIISKLDKMTEGKDPFVPTYGKGDVVHDCPKHVQEIKTGKRGKVTNHTLNEAGDVNFVDVDFGTGKVFKNIPTKKLKVLEMHQHEHATNEEPITGAGEEEMVTETGDKCDCSTVHPGISHKAWDSQQLAEDLRVKPKKDKEMGSSLGYRLTEPQHKKMLAFLKKHRSNPHVKKLLGTLGDKYSDSVSISLDNRPFFVYASYGMLRIGAGGAVSQWNDRMKKALVKYIGEGFMAKPIRLDEAPMDKRFQKEWEKNCKILINHLTHESRNNKYDRTQSAEIRQMINHVNDAYYVPSEMAEIVGMHESKSPKRKTRLTEAFASRKLGAIFGKVGKWDAERKFLASMARSYGLEWDKITDAQVKGPDKNLDRKGIDLIIASKDIDIPGTGRWGWTTRIKKGQLLGATIKGKRVWMGRGERIATGGGRDRTFIGLDKRGYSNVRSILGIDGAVVYHIDPELKSRGAGEKVASRKEAKDGATALLGAKDMKQKNLARYEAARKIRAGAEGKGSLIKMIEQATKLFEKVLKEKLDMLKKGMISAENWNNDSWQTISRAHGNMIREFQYWMREAADQEAQAKKDDSPAGTTSYIQKQMNTYALNIKKQFAKMNSELKRIDKSKEYRKIQGRAY